MKELLNEYEFKLSAYNYALSLISVDGLTIAPKLSNNFRNERYSFLNGEYYKTLTDEKFYDLLKKLNNENLDQITRRKVYLYLKTLNEIKALSKDEFVAFTKLKMEANDAWEEARNKNDYKIFEPYLKQLIKTSKKIAEKRNPNVKAYDLFLDDFEEGMNIEKYDEFFNLIKLKLVPLIKNITSGCKVIKNDFLKRSFDVQLQEKFIKQIMEYLKFDDSFGYCSVSTHPFSLCLSKNDVRITTRYKENDLLDSIFSVIHEIGHATFEHQIKDEFDGTIIQNSITSGIHESQSRLFENYIAKNKSFWVNNYPKLKTFFPSLNNVSLDEFYNAINISQPSLIRTDADELTYPLHILIRYEIEKGIFDNSINLDDLNKTWNKMMKEYLGVTVENDLEGILQDVHWSDASFGYFPAYALGSAYAAQIYHQMNKELDINSILENNEFEKINAWLKEKIHQNASLYTPDEIIKKVCNEAFNPNYYIDYLIDKYSDIYKL